MNFPVFFPVSRELEAETGSQWTASSANQSSLRESLPSFEKNTRRFYLLATHSPVSGAEMAPAGSKSPSGVNRRGRPIFTYPLRRRPLSPRREANCAIVLQLGLCTISFFRAR